MLSVLKKILAFSVSVILTVSGFVGMTNNISDDYAQGKYKNVILMIGDGMSFNNLEATKLYKTDGYLAMETMPVKASSDIDSYIIPYTDSAAGGTALACGTRTTNGALGVFPQDQFGVTYVAMNLCELAQSYGKMTGVVTSDDNSGATPSSFSAHVYDRGEKEEITRQQIEESGIDLIWAAIGVMNAFLVACDLLATPEEWHTL